jgi:hypothetical protein
MNILIDQDIVYHIRTTGYSLRKQSDGLSTLENLNFNVSTFI